MGTLTAGRHFTMGVEQLTAKLGPIRRVVVRVTDYSSQAWFAIELYLRGIPLQ